jgi:hypothetical protein
MWNLSYKGQFRIAVESPQITGLAVSPVFRKRSLGLGYLWGKMRSQKGKT